MPDTSKKIYARAVIDFDKEHSIKQVKDIKKEADRIMNNYNKTGKHNLTAINPEVGIYGKLIKQGNEYKHLLFQINEERMNLIDAGSTIHPESMKSMYGVDFDELEKFVEKYKDLYKRADDFKALVKEIQDSAKDGIIKPSQVNEALKSFETLNSELSKSGLDAGVIAPEGEALESLQNKYKEASRKLQDIINANLTPTEKLELQLKALNKELDEAQRSFLNLYVSGGDTEEAEGDIKRLRKEISKIEKSLKLTPLQKLFNTIKRVGFYRVARNLFKIIEHGFMDGVKDLIQFSDKGNETFSSFARSFEIIRSSIALMVEPLAQIVAPMFEQISYSIADFAEGVSKASSALSGMSEYTKINKEYMKSLRDEANKTALSFDKFNSMDAKDNPFITGTMTAEEMEQATVSTEAQALKTVKHLLETVWGLIVVVGKEIKDLWKGLEPHIEPILEMFTTFLGILGDIIVKIAEISSKTIRWLSDNGLLSASIKGLIIVIAGLKLASFIESLRSLGPIMKILVHQTGALGFAVKGILIVSLVSLVKDLFKTLLQDTPGITKALAAITTAMFTLAAAIWMVKSGGNPFAVAAFGVGLGGLLGSLSSLTANIPQYADGGLVNTGSLFIAGEAGAELITTMPSGQTGVTNVAQFKQAMVEAIHECADIFQPNIEVEAKINPADIANSKTFVSAVNRKNPNLKLR